MNTAMNLQSESSPALRVTPQRLLFTKRETCELLGLSETTLWRLEQRGLLRPVAHIRHKRFSRQEIDRFIAKGTTSSNYHD